MGAIESSDCFHETDSNIGPYDQYIHIVFMVIGWICYLLPIRPFGEHEAQSMVRIISCGHGVIKAWSIALLWLYMGMVFGGYMMYSYSECFDDDPCMPYSNLLNKADYFIFYVMFVGLLFTFFIWFMPMTAWFATLMVFVVYLIWVWIPTTDCAVVKIKWGVGVVLMMSSVLCFAIERVREHTHRIFFSFNMFWYNLIVTFCAVHATWVVSFGYGTWLRSNAFDSTIWPAYLVIAGGAFIRYAVLHFAKMSVHCKPVYELLNDD